MILVIVLALLWLIPKYGPRAARSLGRIPGELRRGTLEAERDLETWKEKRTPPDGDS